MAAAVAPLALCGSQPACVVMAAGILAMLNMQAHGVAVAEAASIASDAVASVLTDATASTIATVRAFIAKAAAIAVAGPRVGREALISRSSTELLTGLDSRGLLHTAAQTVMQFRQDLEAVLQEDAMLAREMALEPDGAEGSAKHPHRTPAFLAFPCPGMQGYLMQTQSPLSTKLPLLPSEGRPVMGNRGLPMEKMKELWEKALAYPKGTEYRRTYLEHIDRLVKDACAIGTVGAPVQPPGPVPPPSSPVPPPPPAPYTEMPVFRPWWIPRWWTGLTHGLFFGGLVATGVAMGGMLMRWLVPQQGHQRAALMSHLAKELA